MEYYFCQNYHLSFFYFMKQQIRKLFALALLALVFSSMQAVTYTVNQSIDYLAPKGCFGPNNPVFNGQDIATLVTINVGVSHNINGYPVGSPNLPSTINQQCWRYLFFDVYKYNNGVETFEATITKYNFWLQGAATTNGSSNIAYDLTVADLVAAGISGGKKVVRLRVRYDYFGSTPHTLNLNVTSNGSALCSQNNIDNGANSPLNCTVGLVDCFTFNPCNANINLFGYVSLQPIYDRMGNIIGYTKEYTYPAFVSGGSGNYSYSWSVTEVPNASSSTSTLKFLYNGNNPHVYLTVTDNVTGCVYYWSSHGKTVMEAEAAVAEMTLSPNPASSYGQVRVDYTLPSSDMVSIQLYDVAGKMVRDLGDQVEGFSGENSMELSLDGIAPGIYLLRLASPLNGNLTKKLIVE